MAMTSEDMEWCWKDPFRGLLHIAAKVTNDAWGRPLLVRYVTKCGFRFSVDDVNKMTKRFEPPTCVRCIGAMLHVAK